MRSAIPIFIIVLMTAYGPLSMLEELDAPDLIRQIKIPYSPEELTNIDWVLITHDHIDHCDPFCRLNLRSL